MYHSCMTWDESTFYTLTGGFHLRGDAASYCEDRLLGSSEPWANLAGVLLSCQRGNFAELSKLKPLMQQHDAYLFWSATSELVGAAGSWEVIKEFCANTDHVFDGHAFQYFSTTTLGNSCDLRATDLLLKIHDTADDEEVRYQAEKELSFLLETEDAEIWKGALEERSASDEDLTVSVNIARVPFRNTVRLAHNDLSKVCKGAVFEGRQLDVRGLAERMVACLISQVAQPERLYRQRIVFEATTGVDLSCFVDPGGNLMVDPTVAVLKSFLRSNRVEAFIPGQRYFFGHPIPP